MAPELGATAVFTVTAVKLPPGEGETRQGDIFEQWLVMQLADEPSFNG